jgi:hypothetical protein
MIKINTFDLKSSVADSVKEVFTIMLSMEMEPCTAELGLGKNKLAPRCFKWVNRN